MVAAARLRAHYSGFGQDVPAAVTASFDDGVTLRFHGGRVERTVLERYSSRLAQVAAELERAGREEEPAYQGASS